VPGRAAAAGFVVTAGTGVLTGVAGVDAVGEELRGLAVVVGEDVD